MRWQNRRQIHHRKIPADTFLRAFAQVILTVHWFVAKSQRCHRNTHLNETFTLCLIRRMCVVVVVLIETFLYGLTDPFRFIVDANTQAIYAVLTSNWTKFSLAIKIEIRVLRSQLKAWDVSSHHAIWLAARMLIRCPQFSLNRGNIKKNWIFFDLSKHSLVMRQKNGILYTRLNFARSFYCLKVDLQIQYTRKSTKSRFKSIRNTQKSTVFIGYKYIERKKTHFGIKCKWRKFTRQRSIQAMRCVRNNNTNRLSEHCCRWIAWK